MISRSEREQQRSEFGFQQGLLLLVQHLNFLEVPADSTQKNAMDAC